MTQPDNETEELFQLVVVGSSAGGIEALTKLVATLPAPFPLPIVIAQHLDPKRPSHLADILSRHSKLPVVIVERQELLQHGTIYVVPSNNHVAITAHDVTILPDGNDRPKPSVDLLLSTASEVYGEKLIAVILTGTGSDGTLGAQNVHHNGGTVIIQNPATAAYSGMPRSLDPKTVDIVADLEQIGPILYNLVSGQPIPAQPHPERELAPFLDQVLSFTGIDFRPYKLPTIQRRLQRRLVATGTTDLTSYGAYLEQHPEEYEQLTNSFLIKVTEFMREPELFNLLQTQTLPDLIAYSRKHNNELRFWSAGCATGEEAYSLAILLCEVLGDELAHFNIKIFATDLDTASIAFARRGFYPATATIQLDPTLVERYFTPVPPRDGYEIKKGVRDLLVFGEHDLGQRAPFPNIDMVMCRNVLIYFSRELQQHALQLFAFALHDQGYLVLGRSETNSPLAEFFAPVDTVLRIYQRQGPRHLRQPLHLTAARPPGLVNPVPSGPASLSRRNFRSTPITNGPNRAVRDNLVLKLPIGVVVVDERFDIQEINSAARRLLSIPTVALGEDFVHLAQYVGPRELAAAITRAIRENLVSSLEEVEVPRLTTGEASFLQITCYPHSEADPTETEGGPRYALIVVTDVTEVVNGRREVERAISNQAQAVAQLTANVTTLQSANARLQTLNGELEKSNRELAEAKAQLEAVATRHIRQMEVMAEANRGLLEANERLAGQNVELRNSNEDYVMHDEEGQAAIEEAETLNEELQATNEELETLNEELQATIEELNTSNADLARQAIEINEQQQRTETAKIQLSAILAGMSDALLLVNSTGEILLTNPAYEHAFPVAAMPVLLDAQGEQVLVAHDSPQARAARGETFNISFSFLRSDGGLQWWEAVGQPIELNGVAQWGLVVMRDITERNLRQTQEQFVALVTHELRTPLTTIKGNTQIVESWLSRLNAPNNEKSLKAIRRALSQIARLEGLINDLGDLNSLQNGKFKFRFAEVRLDDLLAQTTELLQTVITKPQVELVGEPARLTIMGDAPRLQQLVINLVNNAAVHAFDSPAINLSLSRIADEQVELRVQDYGPGIEASHLPELFSRFYQVRHDGNSGTNGHGLGLGLFICQQIVLAHGGTISVESTKGVGTTFIVRLPLKLPSSDQA